MSESEKLRQQLIESEMLTADEVSSLLAEFGQASSKSVTEVSFEFIDWLVQNRHITGFQGTAIMAGHAAALKIGSYRLLDQVAPGQLGGLFHAIQEEFNQPVTLKL